MNYYKNIYNTNIDFFYRSFNTQTLYWTKHLISDNNFVYFNERDINNVSTSYPSEEFVEN